MRASLTKSNRSAVTLIELLMVVTIIGVVVGIGVWKIDVARYQINGDQQVVGTALIAAQREAIAKQHNMIVVFDDANSAMRIVSDSNNNGQADANENVRTITLGDRVRYGLGTATAMSWGSSAISFTTLEGGSGLPCVIFYRNGSARRVPLVHARTVRSGVRPRHPCHSRRTRHGARRVVAL